MYWLGLVPFFWKGCEEIIIVHSQELVHLIVLHKDVSAQLVWKGLCALLVSVVLLLLTKKSAKKNEKRLRLIHNICVFSGTATESATLYSVEDVGLVPHLWFGRCSCTCPPLWGASSSSGRASPLRDSCACWRCWSSSPGRWRTISPRGRKVCRQPRCWRSARWRSRPWTPGKVQQRWPREFPPTETCRAAASRSGSWSSSAGCPAHWSPSAAASVPGAAARGPPGRTDSCKPTLCAWRDASLKTWLLFLSSFCSALVCTMPQGDFKGCGAHDVVFVHNEQRLLIGCCCCLNWR